MNLGRCPVCRCHLDLQVMQADEATRELLGVVVKLPPQLAGPLLAYVGLFKPEKRDLTNDRTLKLIQEVQALTSDTYLLGAAMAETVQQIHTNRQQGGDAQPLKNHNYLKKVIKGISDRIGQAVPVPAKSESSTAAPAGSDSLDAWERQMRKMGKDPEKLLSQFKMPGGDE